MRGVEIYNGINAPSNNDTSHAGSHLAPTMQLHLHQTNTPGSSLMNLMSRIITTGIVIYFVQGV
jgi:hypothetical protein